MMKHFKYMGQMVSVSPKVKRVILESDRKIRYQTEDIKREEIKVNHEEETIVFVPSREDSYDRLLGEASKQFVAFEKSVDDLVMQKLLGELIQHLMSHLTQPEQQIIRLFYWEGISEKNIARLLGITQQAVHGRKKRILKKLRKFSETSEYALLNPFPNG